MDEAIRAAYGSEGGTIPIGFKEEKKHDSSYPLPLLEPEPILQASIRQSLVSWFKRSSGHHPLKLSPMSRWSRSTKASTEGGGGGSRAPSVYSVTPEDTLRASIPPVPPLNLQRQNTGGSASPAELAAPEPVFTRDDAQAYLKNMWPSESERMSTASSWTDATHSTMRASAGPPLTAGLSPPTYHLGSSRNTMTTPSEEGTVMYNLHEQQGETTEGVGLGLQRFDTMGKK